MKIIQVNVWGGHVLQPLCRFIASEKPDIVCVQETMDTSSANGLFNFFQTSHAIKESGSFNEVFSAPTFGFTALDSRITFGNAIFSRLPLTDRQTIFVQGEYSEGQSMNEVDLNARNLQICTVMSDEMSFTLANHHGYHEMNSAGSKKSEASMQRIANVLLPFKTSLILCGDLNINPSSQTMQKLAPLDLRNHVVDSGATTTLSSLHKLENPQIVCDYILTSPNIRIKKFSVSEALVSDHKALILEI